MAIYHLTIHAYRNWRPDHPRGYTRRGTGYQPPDAVEAAKYDDRAAQSPATFSREAQAIMVRATHDFCTRRKFRLFAIGNEDGHFHVVLGWRVFCDWNEVLRRLKNVMSLTLNQHFETPARRWFVRGGSRKRVERRAHLDHLLDTYLPSHSGLFWRAGTEIPSPTPA
jgi:hypothetical protein